MTLEDDAAVRVERPATLADAAELLGGTEGPLLFRGAGTKQGWAGRPAVSALGAPLVVDTTAMTQVLSYQPADLTVAVQAGTPLRDLQAVLAEKGQWLALDPGTEAAGATLGGLLAAGDFGPRRLRYGALRDLVIGVTLVLADGTVARGGGHVIKNVAGYDLPKLLYGSLGTLGLVAEVVLRLHPRAEASATATVPVGVERAEELAVRLLASALEPAAVDWARPGDAQPDGTGDGLLAVRFEGTTAGVDGRRTAVLDLLGEGGRPVDWLTGDDEDAVWRRLADRHRPEPGLTVARVGTLPTRTTDVARALAEAGDAAGVATELAARPALGLHTARFGGPPEAVAAAFTDWRGRLLALGATVLAQDRPPEVDALVDPVGPAPSSVGLLRAVHRRLDPHHRCAPGRLGSWIAPPPATDLPTAPPPTREDQATR